MFLSTRCFMPDGDIFQRKLRGTGRGWVVTSNLLRYGAPIDDLERSISKACADDLRRISSDQVIAKLDILWAAMQAEAARKQGQDAFSRDSYLFLIQELRLQGRSGDFEVATILDNAVKSVFVAKKNECESLSLNQLSESLGEILISNLVEKRLFSRIRDPFMLEQNRDPEQEMAWESKMRNEIMPIGKKMMSQFLNGKARKFRAPVLARRPRKPTSEFLSQNLPVLPQL